MPNCIPRRVTHGNEDYRPSKQPMFHRIRDAAIKFWNGDDIRKRSKYAARRRITPSIDFRHALHHNIRDIREIPMASNHTHPSAASLRTSVAVKIEETILSAGFRPYSVSMSKRDKYDGCRYYFMDKDLDKQFRDDKISEEHVIMMIDVDYYCDINQYLQFGNPVIIYTFVPTTAGGHALDASYTIGCDNLVEYSVKGGATYKHPLWDYQGDNVTVRDKWGNTIVYVIEQHVLEQDANRRIIGFYPIAYYPKYTCPIKPEYGFKRLTPYNGNVICLRNKTEATISVASPSSTNSITITQAIYDALLIRRGESKNPVISDVERILNNEKIPNAATKAPLLFKLLGRGEMKDVSTVASTTALKMRNFQTLHPLVHEDGKPVGRAVAPPLVTEPAFVPAKSFNNDNATVEGRINKVRNTTKTPVEWKSFDNELAEFIVPKEKVATGTPLDYERVIELQNKPAQRGRSTQAQSTLSAEYVNKVKAFIKAEAYGSVTDPRNISTVDVNHQLLYSRFTLAFKEDCLKNNPWFASSMTPEEIATRVQDVSQYPHGIILSDYSRLDGHISEDDKRFKEHVYQRWCAHEHRQALSKALAADRNPSGVTAQGLKYDPGFSQLSGSPGTTNDNNLVTLRHDYIALRLLGYTPSEAWQLIQEWVLGASDDRMRANIPGYAQMLEVVSAKLGHQLKSVVLHPLEGSPVPFLGRIFANPATCPDSVQDIERTLAKLHLTMSPDTTTACQALYNRAHGYYVTDSKTPIIGVWCRKVLDLLSGQGYSFTGATGEENYRVKSGPYPQTNVGLLRDLVCQLLNLESGELDSIESAITNAASIETLPDSIIDNSETVRHKIAAAVGHDILGPMPTVSSEPCSPQTTLNNCANHAMTGIDASSPTCDNQLSPPTTATDTSPSMEATQNPSTRQRSNQRSVRSSMNSAPTKHHPVNRHTREQCNNQRCRYHAKQQPQNQAHGRSNTKSRQSNAPTRK